MKHYLEGEIRAWPKVTHGKMMGCPFYFARVHLVESFIMGSRTTK